jgi:hypothetical protein
MKLVDTMLFSEEYEKDLLLLKLKLSNDCIDEFIICENAYSHQGDYKGHNAKAIVENDARFEPYGHKITVIEGNKQFTVIDKTKMQDDIAFICENWQRGQAKDYFLNKYSDEDWLILHDVDEMFDFTDEKRKADFFENLQKATEGFLVAPRLRYWYDFDNKFSLLYGSPLCTKDYIKKHNHQTLSQIRTEISTLPLDGWKTIPAFEYSSCFDANHILRKLQTTAHTGISHQDLKQALRCNHRTIHGFRKERLRPTKKYFFETIELNEENSPRYVRDNLQLLKTHNIDKNYEANRREDYPQFYSQLSLSKIRIADEVTAIKKKVNKKFRFLVRRLKLEKFVYG